MKKSLLLTTREAANALAISAGGLRNKMCQGKCPVPYVKVNGRNYFKAADVLAYVDSLPTLGGEGR